MKDNCTVSSGSGSGSGSGFGSGSGSGSGSCPCRCFDCRCFVFALMLTWTAWAQAASIGPSQPGAWLVFLCRASDVATEPQPPAFYSQFFSPSDPNLVQAYFMKVSARKIDLSGTLVLGWFGMNVRKADIDPRVRNNGTPIGRGQTAEDCKSAGVAALRASNQTIDPNAWAGFIAVINVNVDAGMAGRNVIANALEPGSFYEHEMLHQMGLLRHTMNLPNDATADHVWGSTKFEAYNDPWDVMSYDVGIFWYDTPTHGKTGPELNMAYRSLMNWLPAERKVAKRVMQDSDRTLQRYVITAVSESQLPGPQLVTVELPGHVRYAIEYRKKSGFDRGVPRGEVVIREWRDDQTTYLVRQNNGHVGFYPGESPFTDLGNYLRISVESIAADANTATVRVETDIGYRPVACRVFNDGSSNISGLSSAIYFRAPSQACIPDGTASGTCRKWFGQCESKPDGGAVTFALFDDGYSNGIPSSSAVYDNQPGVLCAPDGSASGACRKWVGLPSSADGRAVQCYLFNDGQSDMIGPTDALYYLGPAKVCMPDGSATGACRKWFGNCSVTARPKVMPTPPLAHESPRRTACLNACSSDRDQCMLGIPGRTSSPQACLAKLHACTTACPSQ